MGVGETTFAELLGVGSGGGTVRGGVDLEGCGFMAASRRKYTRASLLGRPKRARRPSLNASSKKKTPLGSAEPLTLDLTRGVLSTDAYPWDWQGTTI